MIRLATLLIVASSIGLAQCLLAADEDNVKVAVAVPLSGPFAQVGEMVLAHSKLVVDGINARGGVLAGRKIEIIPFDNKSSPQEALLMLQQIADRGIRLISYCCAAHVAVALSEAIEKHNSREPDHPILLLLEGGDQDLTNEKCSFWTFAFLAKNEMFMQVLTNFIAQQSDVKRVYLINQDYLWGHQAQRFGREMLSRKRPDIAIVGDDLHPLGKVKDFAPYVAKIRAAKPDVVVTANWGSDMVLLVKAAADSGLNVPFYTYLGSIMGAATAMGNTAADKVKSVWRWHPNLGIEKEQLARQEYRKRYNLEYYSLTSTNLFEMLAKAINEAKSTDPLRIGYALEGLRIETSTGSAWLRPDDHQIFEPLYIMTLTRVNGQDVKYDLEGTGIGTRTDARIEASDTIVSTRCEMKRPPKP